MVTYSLAYLFFKLTQAFYLVSINHVETHAEKKYNPYHITSSLSTSRGGLVNTDRLFNKPITTVSRDIVAKTRSNENQAGSKPVSKLKVASIQLAASDSRIPVSAASAPRKKYSNAVM